MPTLPPERWTSVCTELARRLTSAREDVYPACVAALSVDAGNSREVIPYSPERQGPFLTVGQLTAASYWVWKRAYVASARHRDFVAFLWAHVLQERFGVARIFLDRLSLEAPTRFEQLLSLFTSLAPLLVRPARSGDALLLVCHAAIPLVESSFRATAQAFGDSATPRVAFHEVTPANESPLFDRGLVAHLGARPRGGR